MSRSDSAGPGGDRCVNHPPGQARPTSGKEAQLGYRCGAQVRSFPRPPQSKEKDTLVTCPSLSPSSLPSGVPGLHSSVITVGHAGSRESTAWSRRPLVRPLLVLPTPLLAPRRPGRGRAPSVHSRASRRKTGAENASQLTSFPRQPGAWQWPVSLLQVYACVCAWSEAEEMTGTTGLQPPLPSASLGSPGSPSSPAPPHASQPEGSDTEQELRTQV